MRINFFITISSFIILSLFFSCDQNKKVDEMQTSDVASKIEEELEETFSKFKKDVKYPELEKEILYNSDPSKDYLVTISTKFGDMQLVLYDETINHKKNFIKLASLGFYDSTSFHRVMTNFMIQGGDPNSKKGASDTWGLGGPGYTLPAEINPKFIHKKGALAAARTGGNLPNGTLVNPNKESSGSQFYIIQGELISEEQLKEVQNSKILPINQVINTLLNKPENKTSLQQAVRYKKENKPSKVDSILAYFIPEAKKIVDASKVNYSAEQKKIYSEIGGYPFLDMEYTVFGEIVSGIEVIDKIANAKLKSAGSTIPKDKIIVTVKVELFNKKKITRITGYQY